MGENILNIDKSKFSFHIDMGYQDDNGAVRMMEIKEKEIQHIASIPITSFVKDWGRPIQSSMTLESKVENLTKLIQDDFKDTFDMLLRTQPKKLPRKLKKAYKNNKKWAVNLLKKRYPTYSFKNCKYNFDNDDMLSININYEHYNKV